MDLIKGLDLGLEMTAMRYKQIEYRMGMVIEVIKCIPAGERKGQRRGPKKSKEEIRKCNELQAARKLARKIEACDTDLPEGSQTGTEGSSENSE